MAILHVPPLTGCNSGVFAHVLVANEIHLTMLIFPYVIRHMRNNSLKLRLVLVGDPFSVLLDNMRQLNLN